MSRPILVGYCPRTEDRAPLDFACAAARATHAPLLVVAVHTGGTAMDTYTGGELAERPAEATRAVLQPLRAELGTTAELRATEAVTPAAGIAAVAEETEPRLIVLGSSARGAVGRVLPGSTAERVVHGAPCPVAVVPRGYAADGGLKAIGAAFAPTPEGREALRAAALVATVAGAEMRAIMVLDPSMAEHQSPGILAAAHHEHDYGEDRAGALRTDAERILDEAIAALSLPIPIDRDVLFNDPAAGLAAASEHLDLLVMGSRAYGPLRAVMLGGVSRRVMTRAACPVLVLPRGAAGDVDALAAAAEGARAPA